MTCFCKGEVSLNTRGWGWGWGGTYGLPEQKESGLLDGQKVGRDFFLLLQPLQSLFVFIRIILRTYLVFPYLNRFVEAYFAYPKMHPFELYDLT